MNDSELLQLTSQLLERVLRRHGLTCCGRGGLGLEESNEIALEVALRRNIEDGSEAHLGSLREQLLEEVDDVELRTPLSRPCALCLRARRARTLLEFFRLEHSASSLRLGPSDTAWRHIGL